MRTLASVLEAAIQRSAAEITLESEQPVIYRTARGSEAEQDVLPRPELFDMLTAAVSDEHQVELMLGNAIEFGFEVQRTKWRIRAVPGADAMVVRAEREGASLAIAPLPEPSDDLSIDFDDQFGLGLDAPPEVDDPDFDLDSPLPPPRAAPPRPSSFAPSLSDDHRKPAPSRSSEPAPAAFESGTWALDDDDDPEFELDPPQPSIASSLFAASPAFAPATPPVAPAASVFAPPAFASPVFAPPGAAAASRKTAKPAFGDDFVGVPADDDEPARDATKPARDATKPVRSSPSRTRSDLSLQVSPEAETQREIHAVGSAEADTRRELNAVARETPDLVGLAIDIGVGTLVYLLEAGLADPLASSLQAPTIVIDDDSDLGKLGPRMRSLAPGSIVIIRREDPSVLLGWILRRLEEGHRVFLDVRARSLEGARRVLLGTDASPRAEAWLAVQTQVVVESSEAGPRVRAPALASQ